MIVPLELGKTALWGSASIGLVVLTAFGLFLGSNWFTASTATKLASDGYVIAYFQGPGQNMPCTEENKYPHIRPC
jgi:hypothetical protein